MSATDRSREESSKTDSKSKTRYELKKDASNFDDYMLAVGLSALVGILIL